MPSGYTVLQVAGADAGEFLHAQLTRNIQHMHAKQHTLAAWCDAKGRALCTLRVQVTDSGYLLILPATVAAAIRKRLRMFVLRAAVTITDVTTEWTLTGLGHAAAAAPVPGRTQTTPTQTAATDNGYTLGLDDGQLAIALWPATDTPAPAGLPVTTTDWQLAEIDAGLPEVTATTAGLFVPQMLNLHWLNAIDFDKGCYPGQEVIARLQFRGRLTRRLFRMQWHGPQPAVGDTIKDVDGKNQGTVLRAAASGAQTGRLLAVIRVDAIEGTLTAGTTELAALELPYPTATASTS